MDCCSQPGLLPLASALENMRAALTPMADTEMVSLGQSLDRVLAAPLVSPINVPAYDNSAMDGYALRHADASLTQPLQIIGQSLAGHAFAGELAAGQCIRIMTGATLPANADCVIMQEQTQVTGEQLHLLKMPRLNDNIRRAGEDIAQGAAVYAQGQRISPVDIGLIASLGVAQLHVYRRLKVAVFSTGDELTPPGQPLASGHIYDSNRYTLLALLQRLGVEIIDLGLIGDLPQAIREAFAQAAASADVVITSGGVSVGDADYTKSVLEEMGNINFWKVAIKPGKPFAFGQLPKPNKNSGSCIFFGLPGNPVSSVITYHQLVVPSLRHLAGESLSSISDDAISITATTASSFKKQPGRTDFQRGILTNKGANKVTATGAQGSGMLNSLVRANCYVVLEQERGAVAQGEEVQLVPFDRYLR